MPRLLPPLLIRRPAASSTLRRTFWTLPALAALSACGSDSAEPGFDTIILADRATGNAPLRVEFSARLNGPLDHTYTYAWDFGDASESDAPAPAHVFEQAGEYTVSVDVRSEDGGGASRGSTLIQVSPPADLEIGEVQITPRRARAGAEITIAWGLRNTGADVIGEWPLVVFLSETADFGPRAVELARYRRSNDANSQSFAGQEEIFALPADLESGDWFVGVVADPEGLIGDADRSNNTRVAALPLQVRNPTEDGPDLIICGMNIPAFEGVARGQTPSVELGDQLDVSVCLSNTGNRPVAAAEYALFLSRTSDWSDEAIQIGGRTDIPLGSGDRETFTELIDLPPALEAGRWYLIAVADPLDRVEEQIEDNNERAFPGGFDVVEPGAVEGVDLVLMQFEVEGERVFWGQQLGGIVSVRNRGDLAVSRFFVLRISAEPVAGGQTYQLGALNLNGLGAGADLEQVLALPINRTLPEAEYRLVAEVDPTNATNDVNPGNNRRRLPTTITLGGEPDLDPSVAAVSAAPNPVDAGELLTVEATLSNPGRDDTGPFELLVFLNERAAFDREAPILARAPMASLAGGETRAYRVEVAVPPELDQQVPVWHVGVILDPEGRVTADRDRDNNVAFAPQPLVVRGASGGCGEDPFEPNNAPEQAAPIESGEYPALGICDEVDWFVTEVPVGRMLDVEMRWDPADGEPSLRLVTDEGASTRDARGFGGVATLFVEPASEVQRVLIRVTGGGRRLGYSLRLGLSAAPVTARLRTRAVAVSPAVVPAAAQADVDFELVNVGLAASPAGSARLSLAATPALGPNAVALAPVPTPAVGAGESVALRGRVQVPEGTPDGPHVVVVSPIADAPEADRAWGPLRVDTAQACPVDAFEPNGSPHEPDGAVVQAAPLEAGVHGNLVACRGADDWYAVEVAQDERLTVTADFAHAQGDLELSLYAPDGQTVLEQSTSLRDTERVELLRARPAGTYFIRVFLAPGERVANHNTYSLTVEVAPPGACQDDDFEPNGDAQSAALLPDGRHDLVLCPGDQDWFRFAIPAGNTVSFQIASGAAGARIVLYAPDGQRIAEDARRIAHTATTSGTHRLQVLVDSADPVIYQLTVSGVSGVDLEVLSVSLTSEQLEPGADLRARVRVANQRGDLAENVALRFTLSEAAAPGPGARLLAERRIPRLEGAGEVVVDQRLTIPAGVAPGQYHLVVEIDPDRELPDVRPANNRVSTPVEVVGECIDDDDRAHEGPATARPVDPEAGRFEGGVICPFTEDWFSLPVPADGPVTVSLRFVHADGDLDLQVYSEDGRTLLGESRTEEDVERVELAFVPKGDVLVRVYGFLGARNTYTLEWSVPVGVP